MPSLCTESNGAAKSGRCGMNCCATRTILHLEPSFEDGLKRLQFLLRELPLPHEPKSEHRFHFVSVRPFRKPEDDPMEKGGAYAECKHCGCIFPAEES